ncbi:hypothetical protein Hanom_Chr11g00986071 [Helianthus anomalus]
MIDPNIVILIILKIKKVKGCIFQSNRSNRVLAGTQLSALVWGPASGHTGPVWS